MLGTQPMKNFFSDDEPFFSEVKYHLAWKIMGHPSLISQELHKQMREAFDAAAHSVGAEIEMFIVTATHIDICVVSPASYSPVEMVDHLKDKSHEILEKECPAWSSEIVGWGDSTCIATVGSMTSGNLIHRLLNGAEPPRLYDTCAN